MSDVDIKIRLEAAKAEADLRKFTSQVQILGEKEKQAALKTQLLQERLNKVQAAGNNAGRGLNVANIALASFVGNITSRIVSSAVTSLINGFKNLINAGREFEDGLVAVGKTTGIEGRSLQDLGDEITKLSKNIPVATTELLGLATVAGQLGLKSSEDIIQFTETLGKLQLATDIAGEEGAQSVARILTVTGELEKDGTENINKFGNVITRLGNNFAATEAQILRVANRVAQGTAPFGVASEDILGIATALKATGSEAEASGTAIQKTFTLIGEAVTEGGEKLDRFSDAAGLTNDEFVSLFRSDPTRLFEKLATNLGKTNTRGEDLNKTLKDLGLSDLRLVRSLNPLISNYEVLQKAIADARNEATQKVALDEEAGKAADTLSGDLQKLSNAFDALGKQIFKEFGPAMRLAVQGTTEFINFVIRNQGKMVAAFTAIATAAAAMWLAVSGPIGLVLAGLVGLSFVLGDAADAFREVERQAAQTRKTMQDVSEAFKDLDKDSQGFINSYSEVIEAGNNVKGNLVETREELVRVRENYVETGAAAEKAAEDSSKAARKILFFEQDKLKGLKKFFSEEEQAKLESNFAIIKSEKEKETFTRIFASEGTKRQREAFLAKLGLDQATVEAERKKQQELNQLRKAQEAFEIEQENKRLQRLEQLRQQQQDATIAEQQLQLFASESDITFKDAEFERLTQHLDRMTQAEFAAREANVKDEIDKQQLLAEARQKAADNEIAIRQRANSQIQGLERQKSGLQLGLAQATGNAILAITGANSKALFALNKAFAFADIIVKGLQGEALAVAQLGAFAGPVVAQIKANTQLQLATLAATTFGEVASGKFEQGGIVPGSSFTGDNVTARVNSGEMILNRQQQSQLFKMANGQNANGASGDIVVHTTVELDGEKVGESVSRQVANGLVLGEVQ